jgi:hypothetical protein
MLSIKNTITAAQGLADDFNWAAFPVNPKTKTVRPRVSLRLMPVSMVKTMKCVG